LPGTRPFTVKVPLTPGACWEYDVGFKTLGYPLVFEIEALIVEML
jgi:hypothetical protein